MNEINQEKSDFIEKISFLENIVQSNNKEIVEKSQKIEELQNLLEEMTNLKNQFEKERNEQIEIYNSYQEMILEREATAAKQWNERIKNLENSLATSDEALITAQATINNYVIS